MLWIICLGLLCIFFWYCAMTRNPEKHYFDENIGWWIAAMVFFAVFIFTAPSLIISGNNSYAQIKANQKKVISLKSEIETIRQAQYLEIESGTLIGGSLDNQGQSVALTTYIQEYAREKSKYNSQLELLKIYRNMKLYRWFGYGMFIPKKINELKEF